MSGNVHVQSNSLYQHNFVKSTMGYLVNIPEILVK